MDPILEEKQNETPQQKPLSQGSISRGINAINNLQQMGSNLPNPFGKISQRVVVQTALRSFAAFLLGPGLPVMIALVFVFIFTLIIVIAFGGVPSSFTPTTMPTIAPPAAP